jgi:hypothetical protein
MVVLAWGAFCEYLSSLACIRGVSTFASFHVVEVVVMYLQSSLFEDRDWILTTANLGFLLACPDDYSCELRSNPGETKSKPCPSICSQYWFYYSTRISFTLHHGVLNSATSFSFLSHSQLKLNNVLRLSPLYLHRYYFLLLRANPNRHQTVTILLLLPSRTTEKGSDLSD